MKLHFKLFHSSLLIWILAEKFGHFIQIRFRCRHQVCSNLKINLLSIARFPRRKSIHFHISFSVNVSISSLVTQAHSVTSTRLTRSEQRFWQVILCWSMIIFKRYCISGVVLPCVLQFYWGFYLWVNLIFFLEKKRIYSLSFPRNINRSISMEESIYHCLIELKINNLWVGSHCVCSCKVSAVMCHYRYQL